MTEATKRLIWKVLMALGGASEKYEADFIRSFPECREYRFGGLASGAKVWWNPVSRNLLYVNVYPEAETEEVQARVAEINEELQVILRNELWSQFQIAYFLVNDAYPTMAEQLNIPENQEWLKRYEGLKKFMETLEVPVYKHRKVIAMVKVCIMPRTPDPKDGVTINTLTTWKDRTQGAS